MSFEEPIWLYLTPLLFLFFGSLLLYGSRRRDALLSRFIAKRLLDQLTAEGSQARTWMKANCILISVAVIGLALARPQYGVEWSERKARGLDIIFILDSSKSMLATDLHPTRLDRAKLAVIDLVERLESDRIGLIAFAGQAFLQTPPTLDYSAFRESLDAIDPNIMTSGGSDLGNALKEASEAFPTENNVKVAVLLTDGEDLGGHAIEAANSARKEGIQVFAIGIGTPEGEYLKIRNEQGIEEFVRDADDQPVRSQLDESTLQEIAQITGGGYSRLSGESLDQLYNSVIRTLPREERASEVREIRIERFQWALAIALILLALEMLIRRRSSHSIQTSLIILSALAFYPFDVDAQNSMPSQIQEIQRPDTRERLQAETQEGSDARSLYNSAYESLIAGEYIAAEQLFESALSQTNDLELQRDALYNMGHAAHQKGRSTYEAGDPQTALEEIKKAEQLFQSAQEIDGDASIGSDLKEIAQVREAIEKVLERQKEQDPQKEQPSEAEDTEDTEQNQDPSQEGDQQEQEQSKLGEEGEASDQNQSEEAGEPAGQNQAGEPSEDPAREEPAERTEAPDDQGADEASQTAPSESTQDPIDDLPQPQTGEVGNDAGESAGSPEPAAGEAREETLGSVDGEPIGGMTEAEATALLDTLRSEETLLPFIDQPQGGRQIETRDW